MRRNLCNILTLSPALGVFLAAFAGAFCCARQIAPWWLLVSLTTILLLTAWLRVNLLYCTVLLPCALFCGWLLADSAMQPPRPHYRWLLPRAAHGVTACVRIASRPLTSPTLERYVSGRGSYCGELLILAPHYLDKNYAVSGAVALRTQNADLQTQLTKCRLGDVLHVIGVMTVAPSQDDEDGGWYGASLRSRGNHHILLIREIAAIDTHASVWTFSDWLTSIRLALAERLVKGIDNIDDARLLLALGLGLGEFPDRITKQRQAAAGTVHIFAISGMHVGMMALVIALVLRCCMLPLSIQWLGSCVLCIIYVLLTGAAPSSQRALMMTALVLYAHFRHRPTAWLNTLGMAGLVAVLLDPLVVLNLGFLFSYMAVLLLLLRAPAVAQTAAYFTERARWMPRPLRTYRKMKFVTGIVCGMQVGVEAWLGTAALGLCLTRRISLLAPLINVVIAPIAYLTLLLCPLRIILGAIIPCGEPYFAAILGATARLTRFLSEVGADSALCLNAQLPGRLILIIYHALFFLWLMSSPANAADSAKS